MSDSPHPSLMINKLKAYGFSEEPLIVEPLTSKTESSSMESQAVGRMLSEVVLKDHLSDP